MANKRLKKKRNKLKLNQIENQPKKEVVFKIKDTKSVDIEKIRTSKDLHSHGSLDSKKFELKKIEFIDKLDVNKGKYPKEEAVLVWREKDEADKRKIVYRIEDGLERYVIAKDLGLKSMQVNIIDAE